MAKTAEKRLFEIASAQRGYFTSRQAVSAGYQINNHPYYVREGHWIREYRGIYRLTNFPCDTDDQYILWFLWSSNRQGIPRGVYSHETALSIYDVSDIMPVKIHMTVPKLFRRSSKIPNILILHKADLKEQDCRGIRGFRVTSPLRTILDIIAERCIEDRFIKQAIDDFYQRGFFSLKDIHAIVEKEPSVVVLLDKKYIG